MYPTWAEKSTFDYEGSVLTGTTIRYGQDMANVQIIPADQWRALLDAFGRRGAVPLGTSRDNPEPRSMGEWWHENYNTPALMSYIGRILLVEEYAEKNDDGSITIVRTE